MANVLRPPTNLTKAERSKRRSIYLAGPFVPGAWRDEVIAGLTDLDIDVWDPRSDVWESPEAASLSAGAYNGKFSWQLGNADLARVVLFWLPQGVPAPTATLQLGMLAAKRGGPKKGSTVLVGTDVTDGNELVRSFASLTRVFYVGGLADLIRVARFEVMREDG